MLRLAPVLVSALLIAAHFLRVGAMGTVAVCLAFPALLLVRRPWAPRVVQAVLLLASLEWVRTLLAHLAQRQQAGQPWLRMAVILGAVAAFTALSALAVRGRPPREPPALPPTQAR